MQHTRHFFKLLCRHFSKRTKQIKGSAEPEKLPSKKHYDETCQKFCVYCSLLFLQYSNILLQVRLTDVYMHGGLQKPVHWESVNQKHLESLFRLSLHIPLESVLERNTLLVMSLVDMDSPCLQLETRIPNCLGQESIPTLN